nr:AbiH family protein [Enterococcus alcedinis]
MLSVIRWTGGFYVKENLVIVGNGLDLSCGLESTYTHFFDARISKSIEKQLEHFKRYGNGRNFNHRSIIFKGDRAFREYEIPFSEYNEIKEGNLTFWDFLFYYVYGNTSEKEWHNIEQNILNIITKLDLTKKYSDLGRSKEVGFAVIGGDHKKRNIESALKLSSVMAYYVLPADRYCEKKNMDEFLLSELFLFEKDFADFLKNKLSQNKKYQRRIGTQLKKIVGKDIAESENFSVLSFNYTIPNRFKNIITNVHGRLDRDNIIFGIDQNDIKATSSVFKYTKTFRKLVQSKSKDDLIYIDNKNELKNIYFYGHSLSKLDYSYFQSIFDYYEIYQSEVSLVFCCSVYGERTSSEILSEHANLVGALLEQYGLTMNNQNHGKNLMHKLLLEGRLTIKEI